jgi:hypothetical protein
MQLRQPLVDIAKKNSGVCHKVGEERIGVILLRCIAS